MTKKKNTITERELIKRIKDLERRLEEIEAKPSTTTIYITQPVVYPIQTPAPLPWPWGHEIICSQDRMQLSLSHNTLDIV